jgi:hypothetical protein
MMLPMDLIQREHRAQRCVMNCRDVARNVSTLFVVVYVTQVRTAILLLWDKL